MELSKKLKKLRLERGLSQQRLADMIFVSRSAVAKWENVPYVLKCIRHIMNRNQLCIAPP